MLGCLLLAAALRFPRLGAQSLWIDEVFSLDAADLPVGDLLVFADGHPPLHDLLLKATGWATRSDLRGRVLAAVAGTVTVGLVLWFGTVAFDLTTGLLAAVLLATSPVHVWYSREGRMYALAVLWAVASSLCLLAAVRRGGRRRWALYGLLTLCGMATHYLYAAAALAQGLFVLSDRTLRVSHWRRLVVVACVVAGVCLLALPIIVADRSAQSRLCQGIEPLALPYTGFVFLAGFGVGPPLEALHRSSTLAAVAPYWLEVTAVVAVAVPLLFAALRAVRVAGPWARYLVLWAIVPPALVFLLLAAVHVSYNVRYALVSLPPLVLLIALGLRHAGPVLCTVGLVGMLLVSGLSIGRDRADARYAREDLRAAARYLTRVTEPGERVVVSSGYVRPAFRHYYRGPSVLERMNPRPVDRPSQAALALRGLMHRRERTWLVLSRDWDDDPQGLLERELALMHPEGPVVSFPGVRIYRLG